MLKWLIAGAAILYGGFVVLLYAAQRRLQYFPDRQRTSPRAVDLPEAEEVVLDTADGERVIVWHVPPRPGRPVFLYFHGNGGSLRWRDERFRALIADGSGLVALSYRGYGGSSGQPTETGLIEDAAAAYAFAAARYPAERIVLWGESLGSALAVAIAAEKPVGYLVLEAPFTSAVDVGAQHYRFVPVRLFMKDQFSAWPRAHDHARSHRRRRGRRSCRGRSVTPGQAQSARGIGRRASRFAQERSDLRVGKVSAPVLVVQGKNDTTVPLTLGERLYGLIRGPKQFVRIAGSGHNDLGDRAVAAAKQFIAEQ